MLFYEKGKKDKKKKRLGLKINCHENRYKKNG